MLRYFFISLVVLILQTGFYIQSGNCAPIKSSNFKLDDFSEKESLAEDVLFVVKHCKSPNVVVYKANKTKEKALDPEKPIDVYWLMNTENKRKEPVTFIEWKMAFGFKLRTLQKGKQYKLNLNAIKNKEILIVQDKGGRVKGYMKLNGILTQLREVYIDFEYTMFMPDVKFVDFKGTDLKTGKIIKERFNN